VQLHQGNRSLLYLSKVSSLFVLFSLLLRRK
jgi:hypothetical protein